jgi:hypothetical protein
MLQSMQQLESSLISKGDTSDEEDEVTIKIPAASPASPGISSQADPESLNDDSHEHYCKIH